MHTCVSKALISRHLWMIASSSLGKLIEAMMGAIDRLSSHYVREQKEKTEMVN